tara:strand:+ start:7573 stop:8427 length:855 start_codon:yes stop_codon:yes gene_type:complete
MLTEDNYDGIIAKHYKQVAQEEGDKPTSTMADIITREKETHAIDNFVSASLKKRKTENKEDPTMIIDIGCGNGYTLEVLAAKYPKEKFIGVEITKELREIASLRLKNFKNVSIINGDIRDINFSAGQTADVLICQRVIINLLDEEDQRKALKNIIGTVRKNNSKESGGTLLFLEAFSSSLNKLNQAREEFDLAPIKPAHHNLYLEDNFFQVPELEEFITNDFSIPENFLSAHYYITRVLHSMLIKDKPLKRNSEFVNFFTNALKDNTGDYSPLKLHMFQVSKTT